MRFRQSFLFWPLETLSALTFAAASIVLAPNEWSPLAKTFATIISAPIGFLAILCLVFFWNWTRAPYRQRDEARALLELAHQNSTAPLEIRFGSLPPYKMHQSYRLGVFNAGARAVMNVVAELEEIVPHPRDPFFQAHAVFPYRLKSVSNDQVVNPGSEVLFALFDWWVAGGDGRLRIGGIMEDNQGKAPFKIEDDESWNFHIKLSAADYAPIERTFLAQVVNGEVVLDQTN